VHLLALQLPTCVWACRWAIYAGERTEAASSLFLSSATAGANSNALDNQANNREQAFLGDAPDALHFDPSKFHLRNHRRNQDGWGVGWYSSKNPHVAKRYRDWEPAVTVEAVRVDNSGYLFSGDDVSIELVNSTNAELQAFTTNIKSQVLFGHLRASSSSSSSGDGGNVGEAVGDLQRVNTHPFVYNGVLWMHNGGLPQNVLDHLKNTLLCDRLQRVLVQGATDSEHLGAFFVQQLINEDETKEPSIENFCAPRASKEFVPSTTTTTTTETEAVQPEATEGEGDSTEDESTSTSTSTSTSSTTTLVTTPKPNFFYTAFDLVNALRSTIRAITDATGSSDGPNAASINLGISDGNTVLALRYRTAANEDPPSLFYARTTKGVWIASEPLDASTPFDRTQFENYFEKTGAATSSGSAPDPKAGFVPEIVADAEDYSSSLVVSGSFYSAEYGTEARNWYSLGKDELLIYDKQADTLTFECLSAACELDKKERRKRRKRRYLNSLSVFSPKRIYDKVFGEGAGGKPDDDL